VRRRIRSVSPLLYVDDQGLLAPYAGTQLAPPDKRTPFQSSDITYLKTPARVVVTVRASTKGPDGVYPDLPNRTWARPARALAAPC